jgi:hypothetical protein
MNRFEHCQPAEEAESAAGNCSCGTARITPGRKAGFSRLCTTNGVCIYISRGGIGRPEHGAYPSYFHAKNAALHYTLAYHKSPKEQALLKKFRLMGDLDQPLLFED